MAQQFTIWCPPSVRDKFDYYCSFIAAPEDGQRATDGFEAFHQLLSGGAGINPPLRYSPAPSIPQSAIEIEIRVHGVRFYVQADFSQQFIWLHGITA